MRLLAPEPVRTAAEALYSHLSTWGGFTRHGQQDEAFEGHVTVHMRRDDVLEALMRDDLGIAEQRAPDVLRPRRRSLRQAR